VTSTGNADVSKILYNGIPNVGSYTRMVWWRFVKNYDALKVHVSSSFLYEIKNGVHISMNI
jgi:hypothetical protein